MRHSLTVVVGALLVSIGPAVASDDQTAPSALVIRWLGVEYPLDGPAVIQSSGDERRGTTQDALAELDARFGGVDFGAIASSATDGGGPAIGDIWILEVGSGECPSTTVVAPLPLPPVGLVPQMWIYWGALGEATSSGSGIIIDWTTKGAFGGTYDNGVRIEGVSDFWCFSAFGFYVWAPALDGIAEPNEDAD